jgi:hypothetical protein
MKNCPDCSTLMEVVDVSGMPEQPVDDSKIPGVPRVRSACPSCHHVEEGYAKGINLQPLIVPVRPPAPG